jgi:hypothetical protein
MSGTDKGVLLAELFALIAIYITHYPFDLIATIRAFPYMKPFA